MIRLLLGRRAARKYAPAALLLFSLSCVSLPVREGAPLRAGEAAESSPLSLSVIPLKQAYEQGEAVLCTVTLRDEAAATQTVTMIDHASLAFAVYPPSPEGRKKLRFVQPVSSNIVPKDQPVRINPKASLTRVFVFTDLTFEPGQYMLRCEYKTPDAKDPELTRRAYARPVVLTVKEGKPLFHRYLNGLITKEEAIRLAAEKAGVAPQGVGVAAPEAGPNADAMLIIDEMKLYKWWVNIGLATDGASVAPAQSYLIDPYVGGVWREARPFAREDKAQEAPYPKDAKIFQQLRDTRKGMPKEKAP